MNEHFTADEIVDLQELGLEENVVNTWAVDEEE